MISNYRWLISNPIVDGASYLNAWKHFVVLDGLLNTIDYIEPVNKSKRDFIRELAQIVYFCTFVSVISFLI